MTLETGLIWKNRANQLLNPRGSGSETSISDGFLDPDFSLGATLITLETASLESFPKSYYN